jgi:hypothetical protein
MNRASAASPFSVPLPPRVIQHFEALGEFGVRTDAKDDAEPP